ncbi:MAG: HAMP domain-containing histidine kinase [Oscillospiraceae bacterium]|nr:HAMP domain-containing histidine kinase [Oscillospiraceae bacterium]
MKDNRTKSINRSMAFAVVSIAVLFGCVFIALMLSLLGREQQPQVLLHISIGLAVAWLVLVIALFVCVSKLRRALMQPIEQVQQAAQAIARGDYDVRVGELPKKQSEMHLLAAQINSMAERLALAERTKSEFMSTVSHELRTPLTAIKGWSETLVQNDIPDPVLVRRGLGVIIDETTRLDNLVMQLLDFSRMQESQQAPDHEAVDLLAELDEVVYFFCEQRAARDGISLQSNTPDVPAPVLGDAARLRQVFINLLDNAFKHTPQGGVINVTAQFSTETKHLNVEISDTGCGIAAEHLPHITEKFYKAAANTPGSGIGLAVVEEILRAHHATLEFETAPGQGLSVYMTFPLA